MKKQIIAVSLVLLAAPALAQIAVSANDNKMVNEHGKVIVPPRPAPDSVTIIDLNVFPPRVLGEVAVPTSVVGPPTSVAITPDESIALVTAASRKHSTEARMIPDSKLSVIDLKGMKVLATLESGAGAAGVSINKAGNLALVANRSEGTISVFTIKGGTVTAAGKIAVGQGDSGPSTVLFMPDGKRALVTRDGDHGITILAVDGEKVTATPRTLYAGIRPYGASMTPDGRYVAVANIGRGQGDNDTVSLIDLSMGPPRTVDTISVGPTPEGLTVSPDGKYIAVVIHDGSARAPDSPLYTAFGKVVLLGIQSGGRLVKLSEERIGRWAQGSAFSRDSKVLLVQNMVEKDIMVFRIEQDQLRDSLHRIKLPGGGAALRTADR